MHPQEMSRQSKTVREQAYILDINGIRRGWEYGLIGSIKDAKISSTFSVYCLIWSRGLEYVGCEAFGGWIRVFEYG